MPTPDPVPLAPRDLLILSALAAGPLHGYGIVRVVEERSEVLLDPANLYRSLRRMRRDGWVREYKKDQGDQGDERRRSFALTGAGEQVLRAEVERLGRLLRQVGAALGSERRA
jgi:DNA-binding PadR family transcriptional regulator